jgi:hypothetical protein
MLMSGPIVRKYGFPNFDKIFGERPLEHGVDESEPAQSQAKGPGAAGEKGEETARPKGTPTQETKSS